MSRPLQADRQWLARHASGAGNTVRRVVALGLLTSLCTLLQLALMAWLLNAVALAGQPLSSLVLPLLLLITCVLLRAWLHGCREQVAVRTSTEVRQAVRSSLLQAWLRAGPLRQGGSPAELASEWIEQVDALHGYYARYLPQQWLTVLVPLLVLAMVLYLDWLAALFLLLAAPLVPLFMVLVGLGAERLNRQHFQSLARLSGQFLDQLRGLTTLQLFAASERAQEKMAVSAQQYRRLTMKTLRVAFLSSAVLEFFSSVAIAVVAIYVGFALLGYLHWGPAGDLTLFSGLLVLLLAPEFFQPLRQFAQYYHDRAAALGAARLLREREEALQVTAQELPAPQGSRNSRAAIHFEQVEFGYPAAPRPLFQALTLTIDPGEVVALQGASGAGKSTLLQLMAGFLSPQRGSIQVLGQSPGAQPFGWLGQQPFVMQGSWAGNLRLVRARASDQQLWAVLRRVGLAAVLEGREAGLDSPISEAGAGLSGGQLRRLALARALLADYPLLLLDEPSSGLDPHSEQIIIDTLQDLAREGRTLVFASHHPAMLAAASRRIMVDELVLPAPGEPL